MRNKIALIYENGKYSVLVDELVIETVDDIELSFDKFKQMIKNNANANEKSWMFIEETIKSFKNEMVEINEEFKTITVGPIKYFYNTDKVFYISESEMIPLIGGCELMKFICRTSYFKNINNIDSFIELCKFVLENRANYRITEDSIIIFTPALNYGSVEFNFNTKKINKGVAIENGDLEAFKKYILNSIKG